METTGQILNRNLVDTRHLNIHHGTNVRPQSGKTRQNILHSRQVHHYTTDTVRFEMTRKRIC
jgi:hypothetical protein